MRPAAPWLEERAQRTPDATALIEGAARISFGELSHRASIGSATLADLGVVNDSVVAALLGNGSAAVVALHAVDRRSGIWLALNTRLTPREIGFQLDDSGAELLLFDDTTARLAKRVATLQPRLPLLHVSALARGGTAPDASRPRPDPAATFAILYTSGTSGRPKGACLSRQNLLASARASSEHLGSGARDLWLACLPLFHVGGLSILVRSVFDGSPVLLQPRFDAKAVSDALDRHPIRFVSLTATMLQRMIAVREGRPAPDSLRCVLLGGGPLPNRLREVATKQGFPIRATYGLTEACSQVATGSAASPTALLPLPGVDVQIRNGQEQPCATGEIGEICVRGPSVIERYVNLPLPATDGWFHTGDLGRLDRGGRLQVVDRRSDLIVSGGENIYPAEIEAALMEHPALGEVGVGGVEDAEFGRRPVAWWIPADASRDASSEELTRHCRERLAGYKLPIAFVRCQSLPRDANGKLRRRELPTRLEPDPRPAADVTTAAKADP